MNKKDLLRRYHEDFPFSYGGKKHLHDIINIKDKDLSNVLSYSDIYTGFQQYRKPKLLPPIRTYGENYLWEADLMFFTHPDFARANDGYLYILAIIDSFTKMVSLKLLKNKSSTIITKAVDELFHEYKPKYLRVDAGGEFLSKSFTAMCKRNKVKMYIAMEPIKCAMIERFNRTFKRLLVQIMEFNNSIKWRDFVPQALEIYHNRYHSTLKMSPNEADMPINHNKLLRIYLKRYAKFDQIIAKKNKKQTKFRKGQIVKIFSKKNIFTRGYLQNVTKEYFEIYDIDRRLSKDRYFLKDLKGDKVIGSFYEEYLVPFSPPPDGDVFKLDPNHKDFKRKNIRGVPHIFVKWLGWPKKFNQWVPVNQVQHLLR